ncbi:hypothetical protein RHSIM_Rhsim06G0030800 [Rhododendron simsii]|uniref:Uncharacterized protein n=1 Tax=Rhododendron simsii TaxID=118357 RepID=A0A834GXS7_RHOSS|nr:hypothetical protein RHSIM_Rhsim06G0030800 [Rhododendron simsii]
MEAVKQGSAAIGLRSKTHVVLASVNKAQSELSSHQKKIFKADDHIGVAIAGLTADGRVLSRYMRSECINYSYTYESPLPVGRLVVQLADKAQLRIKVVGAGSYWLVAGMVRLVRYGYVENPVSSTAGFVLVVFRALNDNDISIVSLAVDVEMFRVCTQRSWKRPYGVGLLVAGLDESGAHLYYNCPSGNYFEYQAFAIGSRSQAAKTYMERRFESFVSSTREDLLKDALFALRETLQGEKLKSSICTVAVVGVGEAFHILDNETVQALIDAFEIVGEEVPAAEEGGAADEPAVDQGAPAEEGAAPMEI